MKTIIKREKKVFRHSLELTNYKKKNPQIIEVNLIQDNIWSTDGSATE